MASPATQSETTSPVKDTAATPTTTSVPHDCGNTKCTSQAPATSRCARCSSIWYCSRECQAAHWPEHTHRCVAASEVTLDYAMKLVQEGPLSYLRAVYVFHLLQTRTTSVSSVESTLVTSHERSLRSKLKEPGFAFESLFKSPRKVFQGAADGQSTWHLTFQQCLASLPPSALAGVRQPTAEHPLIIYWLGARDDNEGAADFAALDQHLEVPTVLYLIGPAPQSGAPGLTSAKEKRHGALRVRRVVDLYPTKETLLKADYVAMFNAGIDHLFSSWAPAIDALQAQSPPPICFITGYSQDQSYFSTEPILHALGARIIVQPRRSPFGWQPMYPYVNNHHLVAFQGTRAGAKISQSKEERSQELKDIKQALLARGFDIKA